MGDGAGSGLGECAGSPFGHCGCEIPVGHPGQDDLRSMGYSGLELGLADTGAGMTLPKGGREGLRTKSSSWCPGQREEPAKELGAGAEREEGNRNNWCPRSQGRRTAPEGRRGPQCPVGLLVWKARLNLVGAVGRGFAAGEGEEVET